MKSIPIFRLRTLARFAVLALVVGLVLTGRSTKPALAACGTTNLALNQPATSSSSEGAGYTANLAVDGSQATRWGSAFSDPQWLQVDLGSTQSICGVTIIWETAYATAFQIQVSSDASTWTSIYATTTGAGGTQNLTGLSGSGRYIRVYGTVRGTQWGYSLWEFQVYAGATPTPTVQPPTNTPVATATPVSGNGSPWGGVAPNIPGKIFIANFNTGGEGVAYHDVTNPVNNTTNPAFRTSEGIDLENCSDAGCGYDVGWTETGEWEKYTVNVTAGGSYTFDVRVASAQTGSALHLEVDGVNVTGSLSVPNTGGWQTWSDVTKSGISLTAGQHVFRLYTDA